MATVTTEGDISRASRMQDYTATTDEDEDDVVEDNSEHEHHSDEEEEEEQGEEKNERTGAWWLRRCGGASSAGRVVDPRTKWVQEWNRVFLLVCAAGLFVDPLFFYTLSVSDSCMCLFVDAWLAVSVTVLRCMTDALHVWNIFLRFKMAKRSFAFATATPVASAAADSRGSVALSYLKSRRGFLFDLFVILPIPQVRISLPSLFFFFKLNNI